MNESLNTTAMRMLLQLREDDGAGTSQDGVATNNAGSGNIAGLPPDSPPGMTHRKRKRLAKAWNPKLFADLARGGAKTIEMSHYKEDAVELNRYADEIDESNKDGSIEVEPILPNNPKEIEPIPKRKKKSKPSGRSLRAAPNQAHISKRTQ